MEKPLRLPTLEENMRVFLQDVAYPNDRKKYEADFRLMMVVHGMRCEQANAFLVTGSSFYLQLKGLTTALKYLDQREVNAIKTAEENADRGHNAFVKKVLAEALNRTKKKQSIDRLVDAQKLQAILHQLQDTNRGKEKP